MKTKLIGVFCLLLLAAALALPAGCRRENENGGGGGGDDAAPVVNDNLKPFPADTATATITGKVVIDGERPKQYTIPVQGDKYCVECHPEPPVDETALVNEDKTIPNCFVYVKKGVDGWKHTTPAEPVHLDQKGCMYVPHVFGVMAGQKVEISSSDNTTHNVHLVAKKHPEFNIVQKFGQKDVKSFNREEVMVKFKCDVHSWMSSYMGVLNHPFFAVTSDKGEFTLPKLPAGTYELEVWHETYGVTTQSVTIADGATETLELKLKAK